MRHVSCRHHEEDGSGLMEYQTARMQRATAQWLHDQILKCEHSGDPGLDACSGIDRHMESAGWLVAAMVPAVMQDVVIPARADERDLIAYHITAELVCCDIHRRLEAEAAKATFDEKTGQYTMPQSWKDLRYGPDYHPMCHFGGWAASLAKEGPKGDPRRRKEPCVANGGQRPCEPVYWCQVSGEYELPCHGGFDTCCSRPDLHREKP